MAEEANTVLEQGPNLTQAFEDVRFNFTEETFNEALQKFGANNLARALTQRASSLLPPDFQFTVEDLQSGKASVLDKTPLFKDMKMAERQAFFGNPEAFFELFSNVESFGKYDPSRKTSPGLEAASEGLARNLLPGTLMGEGLLLGAKAAKKLSKKLPVRNPATALGRLGLYVTGVTLGGAGGYMVGDEITEEIMGERVPISPSLRASNNFGETSGLTINPSFLAQSRRWTTDKDWLGPSDFLQNFTRVARDKYKKGYDTAIDLTAASANLSPTMLSKAKKSVQGRLRDQTKGPLSARALSAFEQALPNAREFARAHPFVTLGLDTASGLGSASGAFLAEETAPGSNGTRFLYELIGGALPGPLIETGVRLGAKGKDSLSTAIKRYYFDRENAMTAAQEDVAIKRIVGALEASKDYDQKDFEVLLNLIQTEAKALEDGEIPKNVTLTATASGNSLGPAFVQIDGMLSKGLNELSVTSKAGRDAFIQASKNNIIKFQESGDPTLIKAAAILQKGIFEEALSSEMQFKVNNLFSAINAVTKGDLSEIQKSNISRMLYSRLETFVKDSGKMEKDYWSEVGNFEITEFRNFEGEIQELPNIVTIFDTPKSNGGLLFPSETGKATFIANAPKGLVTDLKEIFSYFGRNLDGTALEAAEEAVTPMSTRLRNAYNKFEESEEGLRGTDMFGFLQRATQQLDEMDSVEEKVNFLRAQSEQYRTTSKDYDDPRMVQRFGTALDRLATLEQAKAQEQAAQRLTQTGVIDGEDAPNPMTAERLIEMRSKVLEAAGNIRSGTNKRGNSDTAEKLDRLANAILGDVISQETDSIPYNTARAFTLARRDLTQRTFLGDLDSKDTLGRPRVTPEGMLDYMFKGGNDAVLRRYNELELTNQFIKTKMDLTDDVSEEFVGETNNAFENAFRYTAQQILVDKPDPNDPTQLIKMVDPKALKKFKENPANAQILSSMPSLAIDLKNAATAQKLFSSIDPKTFFAKNPQMEAFELAAGFGTEKPGKAVASIMARDNPFNDLNFLLNTLRNEKSLKILEGGKFDIKEKPRGSIFNSDGKEYSVNDAEQGMRRSIINYAIMRGGGDGLAINPKNIFDTLYTKPPGVKDRDNTLMNWMVSNGLIDGDEEKLIKQSLREMINVEEAFQKGNLENVLFKNPTQAKRTGVRILGATLGQKMQENLNNMLSKVGLGTQGGGIGGGMVAASEGSEALQNLLLVAPETAITKTMQTILNEPKKFADLALPILNAKQDSASVNRLTQTFADFGVNQITKRDAVILRALVDSEEQFEPEGLAVEEDAPVAAPEDAPVKQRKLRDNFLNRLRQDAYEATPFSADSILPQTPPVVPPTPQAQAAPPPNQASSSGPVDRGRYAALFPNDMVSGLVNPNRGQRTFAQGGIVSLMKGR